MSDELGDEPDAGPDWKKKLLEGANMDLSKIKNLEKFKVFEVVTPAWRSKRVSSIRSRWRSLTVTSPKLGKLMYQLDDLYEATLPDKKKGKTRALRIFGDQINNKPPPCSLLQLCY